MWVGALLLCLLGLAACGDDGAEPGEVTSTSGSPGATTEATNGGSSELDDLVAAAQAEGSLVLYTAINETIARAVADAFTSKYGIDVEITRLVSADLHQRFAAEAESGNVIADVIVPSHSTFMDDALASGWLVSLYEAGLPDFPGNYPEAFLLPDAGAAVVSIEPFGIGYNTDRVAPENAPTDWEDLADPRFEGELLLPEPTSAPSHRGMWDLLLNEYGEDWMRAVGANTLRWYDSSVPMIEAVGAGEGSAGTPIVGTFVADMKAAGAPIEFVLPDFAMGAEYSIGISADAPSPGAARLFTHFWLSEEGNSIPVDQFDGPASPLTGEGMGANFVRPRPEAQSEERGNEIRELMGLDPIQ